MPENPHPDLVTVLIPDHEQGGYTVLAAHVVVTTQGETREEALAALDEALALYMENEGALEEADPDSPESRKK
ncbi:type II toxin-antitoxin system HicB family antitoxin [Nocardiopsis synnemataformans]|uniref:type II toxin-antitoxin system HicB family antitoxin n=1 Tax=Nocardiopsis synnemataformans TaxID=61305 RepID=UPI003EB7173F